MVAPFDVSTGRQAGHPLLFPPLIPHNYRDAAFDDADVALAGLVLVVRLHQGPMMQRWSVPPVAGVQSMR